MCKAEEQNRHERGQERVGGRGRTGEGGVKEKMEREHGGERTEEEGKKEGC